MVSGLHQAGASGERQPGLFAGGNGLDGEPTGGANAGEELGGVGGAAAGLGGDGAGGADASPGDAARTTIERVDRPLHAGIAETAGARQTLAEPDRTGERIEDGDRAVRARTADQQSAIVGAEIHRRIGGKDRRAAAPLCKFPGTGPRHGINSGRWVPTVCTLPRLTASEGAKTTPVAMGARMCQDTVHRRPTQPLSNRTSMC